MLEFRLALHSLRHVLVVELWEGADFLGQITPGEMPGELCVITKHRLTLEHLRGAATSPRLLLVRIDRES
jgi:hypothetical protein